MKPSCNGIDTATLQATVDAVRSRPSLARFRFRVRNRWVSGSRSQGWITEFFGAGQEHLHRRGDMVLHADQPAVLVGGDEAPAPIEHLLNALAACLTSSLVQAAAREGISLTAVESAVECDVDLLASMGLPRGATPKIRVMMRVKGEAAAAELEALVDGSRNASPVYDIITNGVPVTIAINTG
ncbi:OsmC family protein [Nonomuraea sp. NPDC050556]|uniref:OsmC family protein n=1 Tax=Nonomuraea sp. NPDC050556 TaxID=3364369 RepID=UPI00379CBC35